MAMQALVKQNRWIWYNGFEVCQQIFSDFYDGWLRNMSPLFLSLILVEGPHPKNGVMHGSRLYPWDNLRLWGGIGSAEALPHTISGLYKIGGAHNNDSLFRTSGTATHFCFLACLQFSVLADDWYGLFCSSGIVHDPYKGLTQKNRVTLLKIVPRISYFSLLGLFQIRISTLYLCWIWIFINDAWTYWINGTDTWNIRKWIGLDNWL
jgi:hypothetical protein